MTKHVVYSSLVATGLIVLGCGPGGIASDGSGFQDVGSDTSSEEAGPSTSMSEPDPSDGSEPGSSTQTGTETGASDWADPDTSDDSEGPEPIDADCTRVWTSLDADESHGHIGATPIGPGPSGAFVSVNPVIASADAVDVDAWIRSWSPSGEVIWQEQLSWGDRRDDPLALLSDELGDVYLGGRINANTFEDAMVSKLDGQTGELVWTFLRGEAGGYSSIAENGAALVVAGMIGDFGSRRLELMAFEPETGDPLWSNEPELVGEVLDTRGLVVADGKVDVLVSQASGSGNSVNILRYQPPASSAELLATLVTDGGPVVAFDLERLDDERLVAVYGLGADSFVAVVDRASGELLDSREIDDFDGVTTTAASEVVALPGGQGLGIAGTISIGTQEHQTFVLRLDTTLSSICSGVLSKADLGVSRSPLLRGLVVGDDGALYTGSFVDNPIRLGVFARWD